MNVAWKLFADLAEHAGGREVTVSVERTDPTVGDAFDALLADHPALEGRVLDDDGEIRDHINLLRNGENVEVGGDGLEEPLTAGDELALFPPVSGG